MENKNESNKINIAIGDWSQDGHNQSENFTYEVNKPVGEMQQAYKDSCKKTEIQFNHNEKYGGKIKVCTEYEENKIPSDAIKILNDAGINMKQYCDKNGYFNNPEDFAELILEFIKLSLPDLAYKQVGYMKREKVPFLNGYWNKSLNVQFGYGLFE